MATKQIGLEAAVFYTVGNVAQCKRLRNVEDRADAIERFDAWAELKGLDVVAERVDVWR